MVTSGAARCSVRPARPLRRFIFAAGIIVVCALVDGVAAQLAENPAGEPTPAPTPAPSPTSAPVPTPAPSPTSAPVPTSPEPTTTTPTPSTSAPTSFSPPDDEDNDYLPEPEDSKAIDSDGETNADPTTATETMSPEPETTKPESSEPPQDTPAPTRTPVPTPPSETPTPTTTRPAIRTDAVNNNSAHSHSTSNPANTMMLVVFAVMCTVFLALWSRRHRRSSDGSNDGSQSMSGMETTSSKEKMSPSVEPKVQYSRINNQRGVDDFEDDDDAEFGRRGSWDDWENNQTHSHHINMRSTQQDSRDYDDEDDRGTGKLTRGMSSSSSVLPGSPPRSAGGRLGGVFSSTPRVASPPSSQSSRLKEIVLADVTPPKPTSVASNSSSNESFEVVPPQPIDLLSGSLSPPKSPFAKSLSSSPIEAQPTVSAPAPRSTEDDLFSQFGMVPTFKKGVQQPPAPAPSITSSALNPFAYSEPATLPVASATVSTLFAADLEDISVAATDATNEWGDEDDDDWVQGL